MVEKVVLTGIEYTSGDRRDLEVPLEELERLAHTAGAVTVGKLVQRRRQADSATFLGQGKLGELKALCLENGADAVIFDDELSGSQIKTIEDYLGIKVIDRTMLILDIFAARAFSGEGKIQVELAQLNYMLPRLMGYGGDLSRLGGGIGTRGPGEKKLETDRRHIRRRITVLKKQLKDIEKQREVLRQGRDKYQMAVCALVGYTNAGKSTLLNGLCDTEVFVEDKLFATLDTTTRKLVLKSGEGDEHKGMDILMVDTVGFIKKLPTQLIEAFKSTLEEVKFADVIIHVVDSSADDPEGHIKVAEETLEIIGAGDKPALLALNKIDRPARGPGTALNYQILQRYQGVYEVSAKEKIGLEEMMTGLKGILSREEVDLSVIIPYNEGRISSFIHDNARIIKTSYLESGVRFNLVIDRSKVNVIKPYLAGSRE